MSIEFINASIKKGNNIILENINTTINSNSIYGVFGKVGSGKSSLLKTLASKLAPSAGEVIINSKVELLPENFTFHKIIKQSFQYFQQRYNSHDSELGPTLLEVFQNQIKPIGTIDSNSIELPEKRFSESEIHRLSKIFDVEKLLDRKITNLSSGETKRSLIVNCLLMKPDILALDNPYTGLDEETRGQLNQYLYKLLLEEKIGLIIAADYRFLPNKIENLYMIENNQLKSISRQEIGTEYSQNTVKDLQFPLKISEQRNFNKAVEFRNTNIIYGGKKIIENLNWTVKKGDNWALIGPNGSGKSTILSLITADNPQAYKNDITLFDKKRGTGESIWDIKKKIGFVSGELQTYYNKNLSVWDTIASGFFDTMSVIRNLEKEQISSINLLIDFFEIIDLKDRKLNQLSFGQQRLIFLARALVKNPPLLILDEPCQGLDGEQIEKLKIYLNEISIHPNQTLIYVSHYENEIPSCINKRIELRNGKIIKIVY